MATNPFGLTYLNTKAPAPVFGNSNPSSTYFQQTNPTSVTNAGKPNNTVLGVNVSANPGGGNVNSITTQNTGGQNVQTPSGPDYSGYYSQVDQILGGLNDQRSSQEQIAQNTYDTGAATLQDQLTTGQNTLDTNQAKSLKDISASIANGFRAGNNYLGSIGAADSSAANQYAYALAKEGSKQRGQVMADYQNHMSALQQSYNYGLTQLQGARENAILQIASWFSQQQNAIRGQKADVAKQQSDAVYNQALQYLSNVQQQAAVQQSNLQNWALSQSKSISQYVNNLQQVSQYQSANQGMNTQPQIGTTAPNYFNSANNSKSDSSKQTSFFPDYNYLS